MIQKHLTSQPLSKRLEKLGVPQKGMYYWTKYDHKDEWKIDYRDFDHKTVPIEFENCRAFLSSELGEILPEFIYWNVSDGRTTRLCLPLIVKRVNRLWWVSYQDLSAEPEYRIYGHETYSESMAESMGLMLEYLILNGLIKL